MDFCGIFLPCVLVLLVLYMVLEFNYFLRSLVTLVIARFFKKRVHILDETRVYGVCLSTDIDNLLNHMNNARFIRELDFAKIDFNVRTGLYGKIRSFGGSVLLSATTIRYRRLLKIFQRYYITTKIVHWDDQHIYMEHRFVTPGDSFINAIVMCKARITKCNAEDVMRDLLVNSPVDDIEKAKKQKPELPLELAKWIESNEISSTKLRSTVS